MGTMENNDDPDAMWYFWVWFDSLRPSMSGRSVHLTTLFFLCKLD